MPAARRRTGCRGRPALPSPEQFRSDHDESLVREFTAGEADVFADAKNLIENDAGRCEAGGRLRDMGGKIRRLRLYVASESYFPSVDLRSDHKGRPVAAA